VDGHGRCGDVDGRPPAFARQGGLTQAAGPCSLLRLPTETRRVLCRRAALECTPERLACVKFMPSLPASAALQTNVRVTALRTNPIYLCSSFGVSGSLLDEPTSGGVHLLQAHPSCCCPALNSLSLQASDFYLHGTLYKRHTSARLTDPSLPSEVLAFSNHYQVTPQFALCAALTRSGPPPARRTVSSSGSAGTSEGGHDLPRLRASSVRLVGRAGLLHGAQPASQA
jgi:hypothetical protein